MQQKKKCVNFMYNNDYHNSSSISMPTFAIIIMIIVLVAVILIVIVNELGLNTKSENAAESEAKVEELLKQKQYSVIVPKEYIEHDNLIAVAYDNAIYLQLKEYDTDDDRYVSKNKLCDVIEEDLPFKGTDAGDEITAQDGMGINCSKNTSLYASTFDDNIIFIVNDESGGFDILCNIDAYDEFSADTFQEVINYNAWKSIWIKDENTIICSLDDSEWTKFCESLVYVESNLSPMLSEGLKSYSLVFKRGEGLMVSYSVHYDMSSDAMYVYNDKNFVFSTSYLLTDDFSTFNITNSDIQKWFLS